MELDYWHEWIKSLPDWAVTLMFVCLAVILFASFVSTDLDSPLVKVALFVVGGAAIYLYWIR